VHILSGKSLRQSLWQPLAQRLQQCAPACVCMCVCSCVCMYACTCVCVPAWATQRGLIKMLEVGPCIVAYFDNHSKTSEHHKWWWKSVWPISLLRSPRETFCSNNSNIWPLPGLNITQLVQQVVDGGDVAVNLRCTQLECRHVFPNLLTSWSVSRYVL